jgi:hypothetical protein
VQFNAEYYKLNESVRCNTFFESDDPGLSSDTGGVSCLRYIVKIVSSHYAACYSDTRNSVSGGVFPISPIHLSPFDAV